MNFQVYTQAFLCKHVKVENCTFHDCRQAVKFEHGGDAGDLERHPGDPIVNVDPPSKYNVWIKDSLFDLEGVQGDGTYSLLTPMAIWIESEGLYNVLVDNCRIQGTNEYLPPGYTTQIESNFRNGIVVDVQDDPSLCTVNLAVTVPAVPPPGSPGPGYIRDVYDHGIYVRTQASAAFVNALEPRKYPFRNDAGIQHLEISGCTAESWSADGEGIHVEMKSTYADTTFGVYESTIHDNTGAGVSITAMDGGRLNRGEVMETKLYTNGNGGIRARSQGGILSLSLSRNEIYDPTPSQNQGYAGVYLETAPETAASHLDVEMQQNKIHHLEGRGLWAYAGDTNLTLSPRLSLTSADDRIYYNLGDGVLLDDGGTGSPLEAGLYFLTSCYNGGMGLSFDDPDQAVTVVNGIFYYNDGVDVGPPGPSNPFAGTISFSDWGTGYEGGGSGHGQGCISDEPLFDDAQFHLKWVEGNPPQQSKCVDNGDDTAAPSVRVDMEGDDRRIDVIPGGAKADMGADEYDPNGQGGGAP